MGDRQPTPLIGRRERVPTHVEAAVLTALEKLPADRFASAAAFARALTSEGAYRRESASQSGAHVAARKLRNAVVALVVAFVIVSGLALWGWLRRADDTLIAGTTARATIPLPPDQLLGADARPFDIASDGTEVVYVADVAGRQSLFVRPLGTFDARALPGTDGGAGTARRAVRRQSHGDHGGASTRFRGVQGPRQRLCAVRGLTRGNADLRRGWIRSHDGVGGPERARIRDGRATSGLPLPSVRARR